MGHKAIFPCRTTAFATELQRLLLRVFRDLICKSAKETVLFSSNLFLFRLIGTFGQSEMNDVLSFRLLYISLGLCLTKFVGFGL